MAYFGLSLTTYTSYFLPLRIVLLLIHRIAIKSTMFLERSVYFPVAENSDWLALIMKQFVMSQQSYTPYNVARTMLHFKLVLVIIIVYGESFCFWE